MASGSPRLHRRRRLASLEPTARRFRATLWRLQSRDSLFEHLQARSSGRFRNQDFRLEFWEDAKDLAGARLETRDG